MSVECIFLNIYRVNKNIIVGNILCYLLKVDLLIYECDIGRKVCVL